MKIRLRELLNSLHAKAFMLQMSIDSYPNKGEYKFSEQQLKNMQDREYYMKSKIHSKKLEKLRAKKNEGKEGRNLKMDAVLNLSDKPFSEAQRRVLARGFKFRPTIPGIPVLDIVTATESVIIKSKMEMAQAALLRNTVVTELKRMERMEKQRPTKSNLSKEEWAAIKQIREDHDTIVIPADKGDRSIRMEYGEIEQYADQEGEELELAIVGEDTYLEKMADRIKEHHILKKDPTKKHENKLNLALDRMRKLKVKGKVKEGLILERAKLAKYKTEGAIAPQLRCQMKDHKPLKPFREIADNSKSPGHELGKVLDRLFEPYTGKTRSAVKGGKHLIEMIREGRFDKEFLGSCDAVALYPSVIIEEGLELREEKIRKDKAFAKRTNLTKAEIMELTRLCTEQPYFECEIGFFAQSKGTHMGGPLSRLLADLIIENKIEKKILQHPRWKKCWDWVRLIDDTLSGWESEEVFDEFFEFLNTLHPGIKWTCEKEQNGKLAIFDIQLIREGTKLATSVYRSHQHRTGIFLIPHGKHGKRRWVLSIY